MLFYRDDKGRLIVESLAADDDVIIDAFVSAIEASAKLGMSKMTREEIDANFDKIEKARTERGL